eukprot:2309927-Heterocapsa_arctica.AAC.1
MVFVEEKMIAIDARLADLQAKLLNIPEGEFFDAVDGHSSKIRRREALSSNASTRGPSTVNPIDNLNDARRVWL